MYKSLRTPLKVWIIAIAALAGSLVAAGYAAASNSHRQSRTSLTTVNVGVLPIADVAPVYLGIKEGFFAKQHLNALSAGPGSVIRPPW